jgi:hypothetical protein
MPSSQLSPDDFRECAILEGMVTTTNPDGSTHLSPMGPRVDWPVTRLFFRPYAGSTTCSNLERNRRGIFHVVDDALLVARGAIGSLQSLPPLVPAPKPYGERLGNCVRWYAFEIESADLTREPYEMLARVTHEGRVDDFFGFNRAKHAVIEAAILATRLEFLPADEVLDDFARLAIAVEKTGGPQERQAFGELQQHVNDQFGKAETRTAE